MMAPRLSRRRLLAVAAAGSGCWVSAPARAATPPRLLTGTDFSLEIGPVPVAFTGARRMAIGVDGMVPGPILRCRQGDTITLAVTNRLTEPTSIHWHGLRVPSPMDGVPGFSFAGIPPGATFVYRFAVPDSGTFWYHSHSGFQEQLGLYGAIVVDPRDGYRDRFDRDYVVLLSDWSDERPAAIVSNLKFQNDYYNRGQRTVGTLVRDISRDGLTATIADRAEWGRMRMSPTDILDVNGSTYTYLMNGVPSAGNWTALFRSGERVRLRFVNGSSMSIFDVRIPGLKMTVVQADGNDVAPVAVDEFRIGTAETYDVIVQPDSDRAFAVFAQAEDRSGYVSGTLAPRAGMTAVVPPMDARPLRNMADMGMAGMDPVAMAAMPEDPTGPRIGVTVDNVAMMASRRLDEPGGGLGDNGRRGLTYADLRALRPGRDPRPASREITLHLTGNMQRYIWGFDGRTMAESEPIALRLGERVRFTLTNDTMMEHPIHLHGLWSELDNGQDAYRPYKHTILVKPGERLSFFVTADTPGRWAFHCHLLYHMELGMFREVRVA